MLIDRMLPAMALCLGLAACNPSAGNESANAGDAAANAAVDEAGTGNEADAGNEAGTGNTAAPANAVAPAGACPIVESLDWSAWINAMPGSARRLHVKGVVKVSTAGYQVTLTEGPLDKMNPPNQHLHLNVTPPPAGTVVAQVITAHQVQISLPAQPAYASVVVDCEGQEIERITDIRTVH